MFEHMPLNGQIGRTFQQIGGPTSSSMLQQVMQMFPGISMQQADMYMRQGMFGQFGGQGQGFGGMGMGMGGDMSLSGLLGMQQTDNAWARNAQLKEWDDVKPRFQNAMNEYDTDAMNVGARGLAAGFLANPEAINDQTQQNILNKAQTVNTAQNQARLHAAAMDAAERGLAGGGQLAGIQDQIRGDTSRQMAQTNSDIGIQRALRKNQDITNAIGIGQGLAGQRAGFNQQNTATWANSIPQYKADDYSGLASLLANQQSGARGFGGGGMGPQIGRAQVQGPAAGGWNFNNMQESVSPYYGARPTNSYVGAGTAIQTQDPRFEQMQGGQQRRTNWSPFASGAGGQGGAMGGFGF